MMYEVVKAKTTEEALAAAKIKTGMLVRVTDVVASANGDGTYSVRVVKVEKPSDETLEDKS